MPASGLFISYTWMSAIMWVALLKLSLSIRLARAFFTHLQKGERRWVSSANCLTRLNQVDAAVNSSTQTNLLTTGSLYPWYGRDLEMICVEKVVCTDFQTSSNMVCAAVCCAASFSGLLLGPGKTSPHDTWNYLLSFCND